MTKNLEQLIVCARSAAVTIELQAKQLEHFTTFIADNLTYFAAKVEEEEKKKNGI